MPTRRQFLESCSVSLAALLSRRASAMWPVDSAPLREFSYGDVTLHSPPHEAQLRTTHAVLMNLSED